MGAVDTTYTFTATDTITSAKMNNIIDQTTITTDAIIGTTLDVASGKLKIRSSGITSNEMGSSSVTTSAIADGSVTPAKFSSGGPSWDGGTFTIKQGAIELGGAIESNSNSFIDFHSSFPIIDHDARIIRGTGANGTLTISNIGTGAIVTSASGGVTFGTANMPTPSGSAPIYGARAWVNFNGNPSTPTITAQGNVSAVARVGAAVGRYTITFATAMPDANYSIFAWARDANTTDNNYFVSASSTDSKTTTSFVVEVNSPGGTVNSPEINVMVMR